MKNKLLLAIFVFALIIRVWNINALPPSLNWDEVSHGYNAYSIIQTGKDEWGEVLPLIFRAYGDYKLPVYIYLTALFEYLLGVSVLSVRLTSILAGSFSVVLVYFLSLEIFKKRSTATISALLMAIVPWSLFLSRIALEANLALALVIAGFLFFIKGVRGSKWLLVVSMLFFGLSMWTYNSCRVFVPIIMVLMGILYRAELSQKLKANKRVFIAIAVVLTVIFTPVAYQMVNSVGLARYENIQILDSGAIARIENSRASSGLPSIPARLVYNKATYMAINIFGNYTKHFGLNFLFFTGGDNYQFSVPGQGLLYIVNIPFLFIGLWATRKVKSKEKILLLLWLFAAPIAASITRESPHVLRSILMLPPLVILIGLGVSFFDRYRFSTKRILLFVYVTALLISFADYAHNALNIYRQRYSQSWQYGYEQLVDKIRDRYDSYEKIVITKKYGEPHEFLFYHWPWSPAMLQADTSKIQFKQSNWYWTDKFDKFYFVNDWDIPKTGVKFVLESGQEIECASCMLITAGGAPENWRQLDTIYFLDGSVAFEIYEH